MTKLTKEQIKRREELAAAIRKQKDVLNEAICDFNDAILAASSEVTGALADYNDAVKAANAFQQDIASEIDNFISDKSEKWQEGERGEAYTAWKEIWEEELETFDVDLPNNLDELEEDVADALDERAETP